MLTPGLSLNITGAKRSQHALNSASTGLTDKCLGLGILRRSTTYIHVGVVPLITRKERIGQAVVRTTISEPHMRPKEVPLRYFCCKHLVRQPTETSEVGMLAHGFNVGS